jgi:DNA-binding SARP family transcriptional activator/TolB-like protein/Flp pilus assembly protein TadD
VLRLALFGGFEARLSAAGEVLLPTRKAKLVLARLALPPGRVHTREQLIDLLWSDRGQSQARASLRQELSALRRALAPTRPSVLRIERDRVWLDGNAVEVDVAEFETLAASSNAEDWRRCLTLYRGPLLEGISVADDACETWLSFERGRYRERHLDLLGKLLEHELTAREFDAAGEVAMRLLAIDSLSEEGHRGLMRVYAERGDHGRALKQYQQCRELLQRELRVQPGAETRELYETLRAQRASPLSPRLSSMSGASEREERELPAVAVLAFRNLSEDRAYDYFGDGVAEDLSTALAAWRSFPVIASSSSLTYRDETLAPGEIGRQLGAQYLVCGSVRPGEQRVRVAARLVEVATGRQVWAGQYDRVTAHMFDVQDDITRRVAAILIPEVENAELKKMVTKRTENLAAWQSCVRGRSLLNQYNCEGNAAARACFQRAVAEDPQYADAWIGLAYSYMRDIDVGCGGERDHLLEQAFVAARRAVAFDPDSSAGHLCLGQAHVWAENHDLAIEETQAAVALNPYNAHARMALGNRLELAGRTAEGIASMERSLRLNPRDPNRFTYMGYLARAYVRLGRYEVALRWARRMVELKPEFPDAHYRLAICLAHLDRASEARDALAHCERLRPGYLKQRSDWRPYPGAEANEHFFAGLRRHGLTA